MSENPTPIEPEEDEKELFVVDPEDYQKTRKLQAIHDAKKRVHEVRKGRENVSTQKDLERWKGFLAQSVATYGSELLPLIEDALETGLLDESVIHARAGDIDVIEFITQDGAIVTEDNELKKPTPAESMVAYRQIERIQRQLGLGLDIEEDAGPAQI